MSHSKLYQDSEGKWRWVRKAVNGVIIAASTQGYVRKTNAQKNYAATNGPEAPVLEEPTEE